MDSPLGRASAVARSLARAAWWTTVVVVAASLGLSAAVEGGLLDLANLHPASEFRDRLAQLAPEYVGRRETAIISSIIFLSVTIAGTGMALALHLPATSTGSAIEAVLDRADAFANRTWKEFGSVGVKIALMGLLDTALALLRWGAGEFSTFYLVYGLWGSVALYTAASALFNGHLAAFSRLDRGVSAATAASSLAMAATVVVYLPFLIPVGSNAVFALRRGAPFLDALVGTAAVWPSMRRLARDAAVFKRLPRWCSPGPGHLPTVWPSRGRGVGAADADPDSAATERLLRKLDFTNTAVLVTFNALLCAVYISAGDVWNEAGLAAVAAVVRAYVFPLPYLTALGTACSGFRNDLVTNLAQSTLEAKVQHQRAFMRYLFHEIRVPLNTIGLVLDDQMPLHHDAGGDSGAGAGNDARGAQVPSVAPICYSVEADAAAALRAALEGATHLLSDVLTVEKIESGQFNLEINPFDPRQTLEQALVVFRAACKAKGVALSVDATAVTAEPFGADEFRLRQVMSNFLSNAVKFTPPGGTITVRLETQPRASEDLGAGSPQPAVAERGSLLAGRGAQPWLRFSVADSGAGFSPAEGTSLFQPFSQLRASMHQKGSSSGLGLSISRTIVEAHGGTVGCASEGAGQGATFWFEVPSFERSGDAMMSSGDLRERSTSLTLLHACTTPTEPGGSGVPRSPAPRSPSTAATPHGSADGESHADRPVSLRTIRLPPLIRGPRSAQYSGDYPPSSPGAQGGPPGFSALQSPSRDASGSAEQPQPTRPSPSVSNPAFEGLHVVLVDDSASVRRLMARMLIRLGAAHVDTFEGGVAALQAARQGSRPADVVITDLTMPDMDGCALAERLRHDHFAGVIIGATGHALEEDVRAMLGAGMDEVLVKPVGATALVHALERARAKRARGTEMQHGT